MECRHIANALTLAEIFKPLFMKHLFSCLCFLSICLMSKAQSNSRQSECSQLIFKFANGMSRMPAVALKGSNQARVEMSDFTETTYKLTSYTITLLSEATHTYQSIVNEGALFTKETKEFFEPAKTK